MKRSRRKFTAAFKAQVRLQKIAHKIYEDVTGKLSEEQQVQYKQILTVLIKVLTQKQDDKHKIYSVHEPEVLCIGKGKEHKPYEFGSKSSFAYTRKGKIIVGAMSIEGNVFDGHTLKPQIEQVKEMTGYVPKKAIVDRGYRGQDKVGKTDVVMPKNLKRESYYLKKKREERCRSRAGVEGLISHLKHDFRMLVNYLKGTNGDKINTLLAASAYNMKKWMAMKKKEIIFVFLKNIRKLFSAILEDWTFNWNLEKVNC